MKDYQTAFLQLCLETDILRFGEFTLNSGRRSPYFFNAGLFSSGTALAAAATAYAATIAERLSAAADDVVVFGPAYKGIPLAVATVLELHTRGRSDAVAYAFNRKEPKDHGEGGSVVGAPLRGRRVLIVDDVVTSGKAILEAARFIEAEGGVLAGVVVALDRMETTPDSQQQQQQQQSAVDRLRARLGPAVSVESIVNLDHIMAFMDGRLSDQQMQSMVEHRRRYGAAP